MVKDVYKRQSLLLEILFADTFPIETNENDTIIMIDSIILNNLLNLFNIHFSFSLKKEYQYTLQYFINSIPIQQATQSSHPIHNYYRCLLYTSRCV